MQRFFRSALGFASQAYDAAMLISSGVDAVGGDLTKKDAIRDALRKANYQSVRGPYKYGNNHFPIQNFYLQEAIKDRAALILSKRRRWR
jgi:branched-chain amino acid transport system substrate-binding protein